MSTSEPDKAPDDSSPDSDSANVPAVDLSEQLEQIPAEHRAAVVEIIEQTLSHSGPLPAPQTLIEYDRAFPGLAERIVRLTESEQEHRHGVVTTAVERTIRLQERGQVMGMVALILMLAFCAYLASLGFGPTAGWVAVGLIAAVVSIFVVGRTMDTKAGKHPPEAEQSD